MDNLTPLRRAARAARTRTLSMSTYNANARPDDPATQWFRRHYGSWNNAVATAGLKPGSPTPNRWSDQQLTEALTACHRDLQAPLTLSRYHHWHTHHPDRPPVARLRERNFTSLAHQAGIPTTNARIRHDRFSDHDITTAIRLASAQVPSTTAFNISAPDYNRWRDRQANRSSLPSAAAIILRFASWPAARAHAGVDPDPLGSLRQALADHPHLTARAYTSWSKSRSDAPSLAWLIKHFGSWTAAVATARARQTA